MKDKNNLITDLNSSLINHPTTKHIVNNIKLTQNEISPVNKKETGIAKKSIVGFRKLLILGLISYLREARINNADEIIFIIRSA